MALSTELYGLKSAGTYRFEKDQSVTLNTVEPLNNIRMMVGFSKIGPFNTPVLCTTTKEFTDTFGTIDRAMEKKGAYFHRSCLAALSAGPIYALNLLKLTDEDKVGTMQFSTSATSSAQTEDPDQNLRDYRGMYNIDTFYTPSEECFLETMGRSNTYIKPDVKPSTNDILDFTNIGKTPVSVIVTKASEYNASAYDVTAQEWYGKGNVPECLRDTSYISDFMIDVYVLSGDWGGRFDETDPYARFDSDIKFSKYFDKNKGLLRRKNTTDTTDTLLAQFLNEPDVNLIGKYTGCLIPGFIDKNGHNLYIEYLINSDTAVNGLMCAVNEQIFDGSTLIDGDVNGIDMIGHTLYDKMHNDNFSDIRFLSYNGGISKNEPIDFAGTFSLNDALYGITVNSNSTDEAIISEWSNGVNTDHGTFNLVKNMNVNNDVLYVYYYDEEHSATDGNSYINMYTGGSEAAKSAKQFDEIYNHVKSGNKAYFAVGTDLIPVISIIKKSIYNKHDSNLPTPNPYSNVTSSILASNPIIKYTVKLGDDEHTLADFSGAVNYVLDSAFNEYACVENDNRIMFLEGGTIYNKRTSLGTNDYLIEGDPQNPDNTIDIDWYDNITANPIGTITIDGTTYNITNRTYSPDYIIAKLASNASDLAGTFIHLSANEINTTVMVYNQKDGVVTQPNQFIIPANPEDNAYDTVKVGNYAISKYCENEDGTVTHRLTRIATITGISNEEGIINYRLVTCQDNVEKLAYQPTGTDEIDPDMCVIEVFNKLTDTFTHYDIFTLNGFTVKEYHMPDGTNERQHEILDLLTEESEDANLYMALTDRELIQFRYLVDTFGYGIEPLCKSQYTRLCQGRKSAFAIVNAPSVNDFKNSKDPSFVDKNKSVSAEFIAKGGDPATNPSFLFSLPDKVNGSTWGAYYYPYLKVYSNYTTINVPPAAYVSNNYVAKYGAGSPWTLVAGQNRGVISGNNVVGVESSLIRDNRDWLEPFGINSIIYQNNIGCVIYANKTAQQKPQSALSSINCREACIYIQDGIERILRNYLFETNTAQTRLEIKTLVDNFLDSVKNNGGVYDYRTVMDNSNNTPEVIDHNMGIIDVFIEPVRGLEILVQKLTILRTGAIESGSFD